MYIPTPLVSPGYGMYNTCDRAAPFGSRVKKRDRLGLYCLTLMERPKLSRDQAELTVEGLRRRWKGGALGSPTRSRLLDRQANYVIVELPGAIFTLHKTRQALVVVGWAVEEPFATAGISSLGRRPMNIPMCAGYAGPTAPRRRKTTPRKGR